MTRIIVGDRVAEGDAYRHQSKSKWQLYVWYFAAVVLVGTTTACRTLVTVATLYATASHEDVTDRDDLWGGYEQGKDYVLIESVFLERKQDWAVKPVVAVPGELAPIGQMEWDAPRNVETYYNEREEWPEVIGILEKGTVLRPVALGLRRAKPGDWLYVLAEIRTGSFAGKVVDITDLSDGLERVNGLKLLGPESELLQPKD